MRASILGLTVMLASCSHIQDQTVDEHRNEAVLHHETRRLRKDGSEVEVSLTMSPIRDAAGAVIGIAKIARAHPSLAD